MVEAALDRTGLTAGELAMVGDRLYTDIALGKKHGVCSVLVLTGETTKEDVNAAADVDKPDFVFDSLADVDALLSEEDHGI